jgi:acyl-CoA synthetase (AMP-forming)/AMP-acid ligase II
VAEGSNGCLHIHSAAVGTGYWPQEDAAILGAGRYVTHDMGTVEHGWVHWRGRAGDLINVAGRKVNPESLEAILGNGPGIEDCLVFGVERPGSRRGEEIVICYVSASEHTEHRCRQWAVERLPAWQVPRYWWKVVALGSNQRGKRSRKEWRERFLRDRTS